ncbi:MAG TPA: hypothetical protein VL382_04605, partial [Terriglobales bacterium]|nr:hypothetical protein [Terriglobales bacterium]
MLRRIATVLVLAGVALAQAAPSAAPQKPAAKAGQKPAAKTKASPTGATPTGAVGPDTPVMFVSGLCALQGANIPAQPVTPGPGAPAAARGQCVRAVTKAQFERLITGLGPRAQGAPRAQLAEY